jgi:NTE family protein
MDISLALGAGGPRGPAHIGVIRILEREGFRVRAVSGSSVGSVVAALYAAGLRPNELEEMFVALEPARLSGIPLVDGAGLLSSRGIESLLRAQLGELTLEALKLPCAVVAVDLNSRREVTFRQGNTVGAVLGSIAVPGLYPPVEYPPYLLIDGGALDPVPVRAARQLAPKLPVVAVSLHTPMESPLVSLTGKLPVHPALAERITRLALTQTLEVFAHALDIGQRQLSELRLKVDAPDVIIHPHVGHIGLLDRVEVPEIAALGEQAALKALPDLRRAVSFQARVRRALRRGGMD